MVVTNTLFSSSIAVFLVFDGIWNIVQFFMILKHEMFPF